MIFLFSFIEHGVYIVPEQSIAEIADKTSDKESFKNKIFPVEIILYLFSLIPLLHVKKFSFLFDQGTLTSSLSMFFSCSSSLAILYLISNSKLSL